MSLLIKHVRVIDKNGDYVPVATIVAVAPNAVGVSYANAKKGDSFNKKLGIKIAEGRALIGSPIHYPNRKVTTANIAGEVSRMNLADLVYREVNKMYERADRYDFETNPNFVTFENLGVRLTAKE